MSSFLCIILVILPTLCLCYVRDCSGNKKCRYSTINCLENEDCDILCDGSDACRYSTIYCPTNYNCTIHCLQQGACRQANIYGQNASKLQFIDCATGFYTCIDIKIYCPPNQYGRKRCHIPGDDSMGGDYEPGIQFYAIYGWNDIDFTGYIGTESRVGTMHCTADYSQNCSISTDYNTYSYFTCDDQESICMNPPTISPTKSPLTSFPTTTAPPTTTTMYASTNNVNNVEFGVIVGISFKYIIKENVNISQLQKNEIIEITKTLIDNEVDELNCDIIHPLNEDHEYNITLKEGYINNERSISIEATVFVCDSNSQQQLTVNIEKEIFKNIFIDTINDKTVLIADKTSVHIDVDEIVIPKSPTSTFIYFSSTHLSTASKADDVIWTALYIGGGFLLLCVLIICGIICIKIRSTEKEYQDDMKEMVPTRYTKSTNIGSISHGLSISTPRTPTRTMSEVRSRSPVSNHNKTNRKNMYIVDEDIEEDDDGNDNDENEKETYVEYEKITPQWHDITPSQDNKRMSAIKI